MSDTEAATVVAHKVADILRAELKDRLAAVYLHGSATLGGFRWDVSDLDVLALVHCALSDADLQSIHRSWRPFSIRAAASSSRS